MSNPPGEVIVRNLPVGPLPIPGDPDDMPPVARVSMPNGVDAWVISDYRLARKVLADPRFGRAAAVAPDVPKLTSLDPSSGSIISVDGSAHARLRRIVAGAFTERRVVGLLPIIEQRTEELVDALVAQGPPADLVAGLAASLPLSVLGHMLGIPVADHEEFKEWVPVLFDLSGESVESRTRAFRITHYMSKLIAQKRKEPGEDLISALVQATDEGGRLTNRELVTLSLALLMAGYDSTGDQITLCFLSLLHEPERMVTLRADPDLVPAEVEHLLRTNPSAPATFTRMTTEPVRLAGVTVEPGEPVVVFLMAANRSPAAQRGADGRDGASGSPHLTFGHGVHRCLGAPLARLQLATVIRVVLDRLPRLALAQDLEGLAWKPAAATRGLAEMRVTW
jgi:cytochrome P450